MARIRTYHAARGTRIKVRGQLTAADMGRFERACGAALTTAAPALEIDLTEVTGSDRIADAVMRRLAERGARIRTRVSAAS
jgi:hypothetical protein